jgi:hypothetical protein
MLLLTLILAQKTILRREKRANNRNNVFLLPDKTLYFLFNYLFLEENVACDEELVVYRGKAPRWTYMPTKQ